MDESENTESQHNEADAADTEKLESGQDMHPVGAGTGRGLTSHRTKVIGASAAAVVVAGLLFLTPGDRLLGVGDSSAKVEWGHHGFGEGDPEGGPEGHGPEGMDEHGGPDGEHGGDHHRMPGFPGEQGPQGGRPDSAPPMVTGQS